MRYAISRYKKKQRDDAYRIYVTDCLRMMTENTAKTAVMAGGEQAAAPYMQCRFEEILHPKPKDTRTGDEIAEDVIGRIAKGGKKA